MKGYTEKPWREGLADAGPAHGCGGHHHGLGRGLEAVSGCGGRSPVDPEEDAEKRAE